MLSDDIFMHILNRMKWPILVGNNILMIQMMI
jgi:hypothetical protein